MKKGLIVLLLIVLLILVVLSFNAFANEEQTLKELKDIKKTLEKINKKLDRLPEKEVPVRIERKIPYTVWFLLSGNLALLLIVVVYILWLRGQTNKKIPKDLRKYLKKAIKKKSEHDIKIELIKKGWPTYMIEEAIKSVK